MIWTPSSAALSERINKPVTYRKPIVDATLPDGSRVNIVFGNEVSKRGSNFTIRKFATTPLSILDIADGNGLNYRMAAYFSIVIEEGMNLFVSGETASGKTTLLNAITGFLARRGQDRHHRGHTRAPDAPPQLDPRGGAGHLRGRGQRQYV